MKKNSIALAVLGAMGVISTSALAGDVTVYGVADVGFDYSHVKTGDTKAENQFEMKSGQQSGSRLGIRGSEDLNDCVTVGFILESGFNLDDGRLGQNGRLFGREANLYITTPMGEFSMGRVGGIGGGNGTYGLLGKINPFGTTWGNYAANANNFMIGAGRMDNTFTYRTPKMAGFQLSAQYSLKIATDKDDIAYSTGLEGKEDANRYWALGLSYSHGAFEMITTVDSVDYDNTLPYGQDNSLVATVGGSIDFDVMKPYIGMQYFDKAVMGLISGSRDVSFPTVSSVPLEGYGITLGTDIPAFDGTLKIAAGYMNAEEVEHRDNTFDRWGATIGYQYNLSQRTNLYTAASYMKTTYEFGEKTEQKAAEVLAGIRHTF